MKTTFQEILNKNPCGIAIEFGEEINGWQKLIEFYKPKKLDGSVTIKEIIKSNGIKDAVWALRCIENEESLKSVYMFCADVAASVLSTFENKYTKDFRPRNAIELIKKYVRGEITLENLKTAADSAYSAASTANSAYYAADAAYYAADFVVYSAAHSAVNSVYSAAYSAYSAADFVVYSAANSAVNSVYSAYYSAAHSAYLAASFAANSAAHSAYLAANSAAHSAYYSAKKDKWDEIEGILMKYLTC
ncbi:MAG: hypothetical protein GWP19_00765 [Planctomycetia bacterium]|nr:hypothetical protein [Planctomycetia bacterium]